MSWAIFDNLFGATRFRIQDAWIQDLIIYKLSLGFCYPELPQKFLQRFDTSFETKMMVKSGAIEIIFKFHEPFHKYQLSSLANSAKKDG